MDHIRLIAPDMDATLLDERSQLPPDFAETIRALAGQGILFAAASGLLPASVSCAVAESPYASLHELAKHGIWTWYTVPAFPFLNSIEAKVNRSDAGYRMSDLELGAALRDADCTLPVLFLQSTTDEYILPEWTQEVYNAYSGPKELISEGLDHGTVYAYGQEKIEAAISKMS